MAAQDPMHIPDHPDHLTYVDQMEEKNLPPLLAPVRVARLLDMDRRRVYELVDMGELAAIRCGKRGLRIFSNSLIDWLRRGGSGNYGNV
jgi:Helix-turn-helix domain